MVGGHDISTVHAEMNIITFAAKQGISTKGCDVVITHSPCQVCTKLLIQSGIKKIYYLEPYRINENPFLHLIKMEWLKK
jgi:dCMP deaminase